ncbi:phosphoribulokinase [Candidatus Peregrinibacteria bacterium]|jgi:uridine kinase|nr:phosphoribulokinase [Candidatus Peregrinibacteria bacterium]MBT7483511.1 phosphoribulokinase [Candidatus Peregrinibacteria bacterium]MBT7703042.1 phosphoribulokinase [Candidatus Peregrinibacteria bacterium]
MPDSEIRPFIIGMGGDSGCGKKTMSDNLASIVGEENLLVISMDAYHKWDREEMKTKTITHLNPGCNHLELALDHVKQFKEGKTVWKVIYDHATGKFTEPQKTEPRKFVLIMGLHPYHLREMRDLFDFRIFLSPDEDIRKRWKIYRDVKKRGYTPDEVVKILADRKPDSVGYIKAQEQYADLVINYFALRDLKERATDKDMGVSFIYHEDPKADLKLMKKLFEDRDMYAALQGGALTVTGGNSKKDVQELADVLFDEDSCILQKEVKWKAGVSGICQILLALELDRRVC